MKFMKKNLLVALSAAFLIVSCRKEEKQSANCNQTMSSIAGSYKLTAMKYKSNAGAAETDIFSSLDPCLKDDLIRYKTDGTFDYLDQGTVCDPSESHNGLWSLTGNRMTVNGETMTIRDFNCTDLVLFREGLFTPGDIMTLTYHKQ